MNDLDVCSFCHFPETNVNKLVQVDNVSICAGCAEEALNVLGDKPDIGEVSSIQNLKKPKEIKQYLDDYVIGQEEAKKILSVAAYNHYKRVCIKSRVDIQKSNVLLIGATGTGKTLLIQTLAKLLDVPFVIGDATTLTEAGYIGDDVQSLVQQLYEKADRNVEKAERGIIYIDEIDKIRCAGDDARRDSGKKSVQEALLKLIEDTEVHIKPQMPPAMMIHAREINEVVISTKNILFIFGGAFVGMEKNSKSEIKDKVMGFNVAAVNEETNGVSEYSHDMLIQFGVIPELMGRIPLIAGLEPLNKEDMVSILTKPRNSILKQYKELFKMEGIKLNFHDGAIEYIAEEAMKRKIGARGLKSIIEKQMLDLMYEIPNTEELTVTKDYLIEMGRNQKILK